MQTGYTDTPTMRELVEALNVRLLLRQDRNDGASYGDGYASLQLLSQGAYRNDVSSADEDAVESQEADAVADFCVPSQLRGMHSHVQPQSSRGANAQRQSHALDLDATMVLEDTDGSLHRYVSAESDASDGFVLARPSADFGEQPYEQPLVSEMTPPQRPSARSAHRSVPQSSHSLRRSPLPALPRVESRVLANATQATSGILTEAHSHLSSVQVSQEMCDDTREIDVSEQSRCEPGVDAGDASGYVGRKHETISDNPTHNAVQSEDTLIPQNTATSRGHSVSTTTASSDASTSSSQPPQPVPHPAPTTNQHLHAPIADSSVFSLSQLPLSPIPPPRDRCSSLGDSSLARWPASRENSRVPDTAANAAAAAAVDAGTVGAVEVNQGIGNHSNESVLRAERQNHAVTAGKVSPREHITNPIVASPAAHAANPATSHRLTRSFAWTATQRDLAHARKDSDVLVDATPAHKKKHRRSRGRKSTTTTMPIDEE